MSETPVTSTKCCLLSCPQGGKVCLGSKVLHWLLYSLLARFSAHSILLRKRCTLFWKNFRFFNLVWGGSWFIYRLKGTFFLKNELSSSWQKVRDRTSMCHVGHLTSLTIGLLRPSCNSQLTFDKSTLCKNPCIIRSFIFRDASALIYCVSWTDTLFLHVLVISVFARFPEFHYIIVPTQRTIVCIQYGCFYQFCSIGA